MTEDSWDGEQTLRYQPHQPQLHHQHHRLLPLEDRYQGLSEWSVVIRAEEGENSLPLVSPS